MMLGMPLDSNVYVLIRNQAFFDQIKIKQVNDRTALVMDCILLAGDADRRTSLVIPFIVESNQPMNLFLPSFRKSFELSVIRG